MKNFTLLLFISLALTSCYAPVTVTQLVPEAPEGVHEMGREYIPLKNGDIEVQLGFDGFDAEYMVFDLVVINNTDRVLSMDPGDFYYVLLKEPAGIARRGHGWLAT